MLNAGLVLSTLKYAGFSISAFATIWGIISKTSYEDEAGQKRLTLAGKVAIGVAVLSALVSMNAFGIDAFQRDQTTRDAARDKLLANAAADRKEAAQERQHDLELRQKATDVEQARFLALKAMAQQAAGDALLSRRLAENNARVLSGFSDTLFQIQRVSQPIHRITITMTSAIPLKGIKNDAYMKRLLSAVNGMKQASIEETGTKITRWINGEDSWTTASVSSDSTLFPKADTESDWFELVTGRMKFEFFSDRSRIMRHLHHDGPRDNSIFDILQGKATVEEVTRRAPPPDNPNDPDVTFELKPTSSTISYSTLDDYLTIHYQFDLSWSDVEGSGRIMSQVDLGRASVLISPADFARIYKSQNENDKIPNAERVCRIDMNTGQRDLQRRAFRRLRNYGEMYLLIDDIASYRPPNMYVDLCEHEREADRPVLVN